MWPFGQKKNKRTTISLTPKTISFCVFEQATKYSVLLYSRFPLQNFEYTQAILFNPTALKKIIKTFFKQHNLEQMPVAISVAGPKIIETIVQTKTASPYPGELDKGLKKLNWDSLYLCPSQKGGFDFFVCGIKPEHLFSYQLLGHTCNINVQTIMTEQLSQLYLYKKLKDEKFRQTQLSKDLMEQQYNLYNICSADTVEQKIEINPLLGIDFEKEQRFLKTHLGLFVS